MQSESKEPQQVLGELNHEQDEDEKYEQVLRDLDVQPLEDETAELPKTDQVHVTARRCQPWSTARQYQVIQDVITRMDCYWAGKDVEMVEPADWQEFAALPAARQRV